MQWPSRNHCLEEIKSKIWKKKTKKQGNSSPPLKVAHKGMAPITERFYVEIKPISSQFFQFVWD